MISWILRFFTGARGEDAKATGPPRTAPQILTETNEPMTIAKFDNWATELELEFFQPHELRFLGGSHYLPTGRAAGLNGLPPKGLLTNMERLARAADAIRREFGHPVRILSAYRSAAYNAAVGGASRSEHMMFRALDLAPMRGSVAALHAACVKVRGRGGFVGGIGRYRSFVHIDDRGNNVNFVG
jgi:hypothetical protein